MLERFITQIVLFSIFFVMVYAVIEVIKNFFIMMPDRWGKLFSEGLGDKSSRWLSFFVAYGTAWGFDFRFPQLIFNTIQTDEGGRLPIHINYFIVACLIFVGSKWIYLNIKYHYQHLTGKACDKQTK